MIDTGNQGYNYQPRITANPTRSSEKPNEEVAENKSPNVHSKITSESLTMPDNREMPFVVPTARLSARRYDLLSSNKDIVKAATFKPQNESPAVEFMKPKSVQTENQKNYTEELNAKPSTVDIDHEHDNVNVSNINASSSNNIRNVDEGGVELRARSKHDISDSVDNNGGFIDSPMFQRLRETRVVSPQPLQTDTLTLADVIRQINNKYSLMSQDTNTFHEKLNLLNERSTLLFDRYSIGLLSTN